MGPFEIYRGDWLVPLGGGDLHGSRAPAMANKDKDNDGATPLYTASQKGHVEVVKLLCDAGAAKDQARNDGTTPLFAASQEGHVEVVKLLCDVGANTNQAKKDGSTPLAMASQRGHAELVKLLRESAMRPE